MQLCHFLKDVFELRIVADVENSQAFMVENDDMVVLVFRGTESSNFSDILPDLDCFPRCWSVRGEIVGRVHRGFARTLNRVLPILRDALPEDSSPLVITGHSLGAAMANLAASVLEPAELYTFGEPRVGNGAFAGFMDRRGGLGLTYHRYVDCCDIVTRVPPVCAGFRHPGQLHYIDCHGDIHRTPDLSDTRRDRRVARHQCWDVHSFGRGNVVLRNLADHAPINYLSALLGRRGNKILLDT